MGLKGDAGWRQGDQRFALSSISDLSKGRGNGSAGGSLADE